MRRPIVALAVIVLVLVTALPALAGNSCSDASADSKECAPAKSASTRFAHNGKVLGRFDRAMSGVCRFGCATKIKYDPRDVIAQPGAKAGRFTQCPVSGVVFVVDAGRPHVRLGKDEYVTCCDKCATKLSKDPRHYVRG